MSSKYAARQYAIPPEFPEILKDFAREVLRAQPENLLDFAVKYFERKAQGVQEEKGHAVAPQLESDDVDVPVENIVEMIGELFRTYDKDNSGSLDAQEFRLLFKDLQEMLKFTDEEVMRFLREADADENGQIEYEEFIPVALQIIQSLFAKRRVQDHMAQIEESAKDMLVNGMDREELQETIRFMFDQIDKSGTGSLSREEFKSALDRMDLGLRREEINAILCNVDVDADGKIDWQEFIPFAFDLLHKLTAMKMLDAEVASDSLTQYLMDLFQCADVEATNRLYVEEVRDLLKTENRLGLSRMQLATVMASAKVDDENYVQYNIFVPHAVSVIRSMLSFEKSVVRAEEGDQKKQFCDVFVGLLDELPDPFFLEDLVEKMASVEFLDEYEQTAVIGLANPGNKETPVDRKRLEIEVWPMIKSIRNAFEDDEEADEEEFDE